MKQRVGREGSRECGENCKSEREREGERRRQREKYLSLSEIPGMNGGINFPREGENWMECSEYMP